MKFSEIPIVKSVYSTLYRWKVLSCSSFLFQNDRLYMPFSAMKCAE